MLRKISVSVISLAVVLMFGLRTAVAEVSDGLLFAAEDGGRIGLDTTFVFFLVVTLGLLSLVALVYLKVESEATKLVLFGLVLTVAGVGYETMGGGTIVMSQMIMKISFLLVLAGVACSVFANDDKKGAKK